MGVAREPNAAPARARLWRRLRQAAWLRLAAAALVLTAWPVAMAVWALAAVLAAAGLVPAWLGGAVGALAAVAVAVATLRALRRRFARAPVDPLTSRALAWLNGSGDDREPARDFWRRQMRGVVRDPFWAALGLALVFAATINSVGLWRGPAAAMVGVPYERHVRSTAPLVRLAAVERTSPFDGVRRPVAANDGFLEVDEGALVHWRVEPLRPATAVALAAGDTRMVAPVGADGTAEFSLAVTVPQTYRFSLLRWGVVWTEAWARRLDVRPDTPPEPRWQTPPPAQPPADRLMAFEWRATDDRGLVRVLLEARGDAGETERIDLWQRAVTTAVAPVTAWVDVDELPASDSVVLTLVAVDNDTIAGPNVGRSEPMIVRLRDARVRHEQWRESLVALLEAGVDGLAQAFKPAGVHADLARDLASRALALADEAERVPNASFAARDTLIGIARDWRAASPPTAKPAAVGHAEDAVWHTDELLGREEAAGIEAQQDRLIRRLEDLAASMDDASDADLERLMQLLQRELDELAKAMQSKRPRLPTELIQKEALDSEEVDERGERMQSLSEALRSGDRDAAKQQLEQLIDELRGMREAMAEGATEWLEQQSGGAEQMREQRGALSELQERQAQLAEQAAAAEADRFAAERRAEQAMRRAARRDQAGRAAAEQALEAMRRSDWGAAREALDGVERQARDAAEQALEQAENAARQARELGGRQADLRGAVGEAGKRLDRAGIGSATLKEALDDADGQMRAAEGALEKGEQGGSEHGFRAADALERAAEAAAQMAQGMQGRQAAPGYGRGPRQPGGERDGDVASREPFEAPDAARGGDRSDVLEGFRGGLPDAGRDVNERYLDRLLH